MPPAGGWRAAFRRLLLPACVAGRRRGVQNARGAGRGGSRVMQPPCRSIAGSCDRRGRVGRRASEPLPRARVTSSSRGVRSLVGAHPVRDSLSRRSAWSSLRWAKTFGVALVGLRDGLACRGLPSSCRRPGHFLLLAQEKVTKEKGTPRGAVRASPSQSVRGGRAFRPGSCPDEKCPTSCRAPLRGLLVHPSPPHRGLLKARAAARHIASDNLSLSL